MVRNLKVLGLALAAVFALSAVMASAALAQNGTLTVLDSSNKPENKPVTLTGALIGAKNDNSLTAFGGIVTCEGATYTGHKVKTFAQTKETEEKELPLHEFLEPGASTVTITPHYGNKCITSQAGLEFPTTVDTNGCDFEFDLKGTSAEHEGVKNPADTYTLTATEECPETNTIKVTVFSNATKHAENKPFCVIDITKETHRGEKIVAKDTTNGTIDITGTVEGIKADRESPTGSILCPKEETKTGVLHIKVSVTGHDTLGEPTGVGIDHA